MTEPAPTKRSVGSIGWFDLSVAVVLRFQAPG